MIVAFSPLWIRKNFIGKLNIFELWTSQRRGGVCKMQWLWRALIRIRWQHALFNLTFSSLPGFLSGWYCLASLWYSYICETVINQATTVIDVYRVCSLTLLISPKEACLESPSLSYSSVSPILLFYRVKTARYVLGCRWDLIWIKRAKPIRDITLSLPHKLARSYHNAFYLP